MPYVMGFVASMPRANKDVYITHCKSAAAVFKEYGATRVVETREDEVPEGEITSFPMAVKHEANEANEANEAIIFSWIEWPDKATGDAGMKKSMDDTRLSSVNNPMPFDGRRMINGSFQSIMDV